MADIKKSPCAHLNPHLFEPEKPKAETNPPKSGTKAGKSDKGSKIKGWIGKNLWYWCRANKYTLLTEHEFHPERKWRFDWAVEEIKLAIEYEGGILDPNGDHRSVKGMSRDIEKYNAAQALGWRVIRITALNYKTLLQTIDKL